MTTVNEVRETSGDRDENATSDHCIPFETVDIKQEIDELDVGSTQFQPPDVCYNNLLPVKAEPLSDGEYMLRVKAEPLSDGPSTSKTSPAVLVPYENTYQHLSPKTTDHPCTSELKLPQYRKFSKNFVFECSICGQIFSHNCKLERHMMMHTGDMPHVCSVCNYKTTKPSNLKAHMISHTDERSFECKTCGRKYKNNSNLRVHIKRSHPDEKLDYKTASFGQISW